MAPDRQFLDEQSGHDRLSGAGIVRRKKPERLPEEHLALHRSDLVRKGREGMADDLSFDWDEANFDHIARHRIGPADVAQAFANEMKVRGTHPR